MGTMGCNNLHTCRLTLELGYQEWILRGHYSAWCLTSLVNIKGVFESHIIYLCINTKLKL